MMRLPRSMILSTIRFNLEEVINLLLCILDQHLSWNVHIDNLCKKVASGIGALKRIRPFVNSNTLQTIFSSLIQPYFDYRFVVWDGCCTTLAGKIQKLQNRGAARVLTSASYDTITDILFE